MCVGLCMKVLMNEGIKSYMPQGASPDLFNISQNLTRWALNNCFIVGYKCTVGSAFHFFSKSSFS